MRLPYNRPRLIEIADQPWCPPFIRRATQDQLTWLWTHRIPFFQSAAPYLGVVDILERVIRELELEDEEAGDWEMANVLTKRQQLKIVDCCSGSGGPLPLVEQHLKWVIIEELTPGLMRSSRRRAKALVPVPVVLTDLYPNIEAWSRLVQNTSIWSKLEYHPHSANAKRLPARLRETKHVRTFCLSFHHFSPKEARAILVDAMRSAEAICIFELQGPHLGSMLHIAMTWFLSFLLVLLTSPSIATLFFTFCIPVIPTVLALDGVISCYRTYTPDHIEYLANLASISVALEKEAEGDDSPFPEWTWSSGRSLHSWPFGHMTWVVGRRLDDGDEPS